MNCPTFLLVRLSFYSTFVTACIFISGCLQSSQSEVITPVSVSTREPTATAKATPTEEARIDARWRATNFLSPTVDVELVRITEEPASLQMPALIEAIVAGRDIESVALVAGQILADGNHRLVNYELLYPSNGGTNVAGTWPDGIHDLAFVWSTESDYIAQGTTGTFVVMEDIPDSEGKKAVQGSFSRSAQEDSSPAILVVDTNKEVVESLVDKATGQRIETKPGDIFQVSNLILQANGDIRPIDGLEFNLENEIELTYKKRPLEAGDYILGIAATSREGFVDIASYELLVGNENLLPGLRAYLQPEYSFQFLYPEDWLIIDSSANSVLFQDLKGETSLSVFVDPELNVPGPIDVKDRVLRTFGNVEILYDDSVQVGSQGGKRTIYGYQSLSGPRTGILINFVSNGLVYVVDLDGPAVDEESQLLTAERLINNWIWRSSSSRQPENHWQSITVKEHDFHIPTNSRYDELDNGWHRFSDVSKNKFYAFRVVTNRSTNLEETAAYWAAVAQRDTKDFIASNLYEVQFLGRSWLRIDFKYQSEEFGEIWGAIMTVRSGEDTLVVWYESPREGFELFEDQQVMIGVAHLVRQP